jgi:hypothetical protein
MGWACLHRRLPRDEDITSSRDCCQNMVQGYTQGYTIASMPVAHLHCIVSVGLQLSFIILPDFLLEDKTRE